MVNLGSSAIAVKNNSQKTLKVRLTKSAIKFVNALKKAGIRNVNLNFNVKGKRAKGAKHPYNVTQAVNMGIS